jgi:hypothetical protein
MNTLLHVFAMIMLIMGAFAWFCDGVSAHVLTNGLLISIACSALGIFNQLDKP